MYVQRQPLKFCQDSNWLFMKFQKFPPFVSVLLAVLLASVLFYACSKKQNPKTFTYTIYTPVLKSKAEVLAAINGNRSEKIQQAGKFFLKGNYIYLNEKERGIHIINNSNPSNPVQEAFLEIPGNLDVAVKGNTLYADMYGDLLAIDISNPKSVTLTRRLTNFFIQRTYANNVSVDSNMVAIAWKQKDTTIVVTDYIYPDCPNCMFALGNRQNAHATGNGTAGSMAGVVLMDDYLYAITEPHSLGIVDVSQPAQPVYKNSIYAGMDLETIYPFNDKLFLGSSIGLFMYDMSEPTNPRALGVFSHGRACDPVVADGQNAYVTLRAGTQCGGEFNELNVVDVKDLMAPSLVKSYPLTNPKGLCKDGNLLFVCDATSGVRLYDATDPAKLKQLTQLNVPDSYDVIAGGGHALIVSDGGLYQFDYSDLNHIRQLSVFALK